MATSEQIKALLKSHRDGDDDRFYAIALQMAAQAATQGKSTQAKEIRQMVEAAKEHENSRREESHQLPPELVGILHFTRPDQRIPEMVLDCVTREKLLRVMLEHRQQHCFRSYDLHPRRKLLLVGPPGTGKTMTARVLAGELGLPLYTILIDGLITKFLGETASKLRLVFEAISRQQGVYFFDEFDALGARRTTANDVGEIRRVLNSFLQFLEQEQSESLVLAATNHIDLLDHALFRRFDDVIEYHVPTKPLILEILKNRLFLFECKNVKWPEVVELAEGLSYADITKAGEEAAKEILMRGETELTTEGLAKAVSDRKQMNM